MENSEVEATADDVASPSEVETPIWELPVICRVCQTSTLKNGQPLTRGKLTGHLKTHTIPLPGRGNKTRCFTMADYEKKFGKKAMSDFEHIPNSAEVISKNRQTIIAYNAGELDQPMIPGTERDPNMSSIDEMKAGLGQAELVEFNRIYESVFQQVDRDEVQIPRVASYSFYIIALNRCVAKQMVRNYAYNENVENSIKQNEDRIRKLAVELGISREQRLKARANLKSSPGALISGYVDELERCSVDMLSTMAIEEEIALREVNARVAEYILAVAPTMKEKYIDGDDSAAPDLRAVLQRANLSL